MEDDVKKMIFSDEKMFTVEPKLNRQNSHVYATSRADADAASLKVRRAEFPAKIMVWGAICSSGALQLKFIDPGTKVNKEYYINEVLESVLLPEARRLYPDGDWIFQQDGVPAHTANVTQTWLREHCPQFITKQEWPARSPDLNPLDYSIWGLLEARVNSHPHHSLASLKQAIKHEWKRIPKDTIEKTVAEWRSRLRCCIQHKGDHFEK
uniref:Tc1-like transposase DDE domain-containing protein n=1 Tax=Sphaeramia orbicularis TaxID=375764 RepID=A0A672ZGG9_9TELE